MKKRNIIGLVLATNFIFEVGIALIRNRGLDKEVNNKKVSNNIFENVVFDTHQNAYETLVCLQDIMVDYGVVSVADVKDLIGETGSYKDNGYGWKNISKAYIQTVRRGYLLNLPNPIVLD